MNLRASSFLLVPATTVVLGVLAMTIGAGSGELYAARVSGGPTDASGPSTLRIECVRRASGAEDHVPMANLDVTIGSQKQQVSCGPDGSVDVPYQADGSPLHVEVRNGTSVLAEGTANVTHGQWLASARTLPARLPASGSLAGKIRGYIEGGTAPLARATPLLLDVPPELRKPGALTVSGLGGAEVSPPELQSRGWVMMVTPTFVTATIEARAGDEVWEARLPVQGAALVAEDLTTSDDTLKATIRSLPARDRAYVRIADDRGRIAATTVALTADGRGGTFGKLEMPMPELTGRGFLILGTDPDASGSSASSIPIPKVDLTRDARIVPDARWIDGMVPIRAADATRWNKRARAVGMLVAAAALLEALLLVDRGRSARARLRSHLATFGDRPELGAVEAEGGVFAIALGAAAVLFGFAVIGVLFLARLG